MLGLGTGEMVILGGIIFVVFGTKRIPEIGSSLAKGIKNFQKGLKSDPSSDVEKEIQNLDAAKRVEAEESKNQA